MSSGDLLRQRIFDALEQRLERGEPTMTYEELANFTVDGEKRRLRANSKGIWNPQWLNETLTIYSALSSPYSDQELSPGIWPYVYQARPIEGDNTKLTARVRFPSPAPAETRWRIRILDFFSLSSENPSWPMYLARQESR